MTPRRQWYAFVFVLSLIAPAGMTVRADEPVRPFPAVSLLPKQETGALRFLEQHPQFDGRGVTVAVFDTGVDPGAPGLQETSDGQPKIIDIVDTTGSGDVSVKAERTAKDGEIEGLSGRILKINPNWKNPSGKFHLGIKPGYDLFPQELIDRLSAERRREWDRRQDARAAELQQKLQAWDAQHPQPSSRQLEWRKELEARVDVLKAARDSYDDPGPVYDCLTFHDGDVWRAVIDTDEDGDLSEELALTDYHRERQYASFSSQSQLNFSVNIYDEGRVLSIVTFSGSHGTHVAGIVGACHPEAPERNGIAPGVQIVSVKIGDTRVDGMETGRALVRGLRTVLDRKCDLINMSYGEPTSLPNGGRLIDLFSEVVREQGVIFVASAGNAGPALSTVGAPGGTTDAILGIGAYVSRDLMSSAYTLRAPYEGLPYSWTSRGPTTDGDLGINLFAPGGAIAPVPNYSLQPSQLMNGTSMASPNACGNIALLLSALKAEGIDYTPSSIRRSLENTAIRLEGISRFAQGHGLLQVDRAHAWFKENRVSPAEKLSYRIDVGTQKARGFLLREPDDFREPVVQRVFIHPEFPEDTPKRQLVDLEIPLTIRSTNEWIHVGEHLLLTAGGNYFEAEVDPRELVPGAHYGEIQVFAADALNRGPLIRVPVSVIKPQPEDAGPPEFDLTLDPGDVSRQFLVPPTGATWADVEVHLIDADAPRRFMLHTVQLLPGRSFEEGELNTLLALEPSESVCRSVTVVPGRTLEVCLAQYWSSLGSSRVRVTVRFRGIEPDDDEIMLPSDGSPTSIRLTSRVRRERLEPTASLTTRRQLLTAESVRIEPMTTQRDRLPDGRPTSRLLLTYRFTQPAKGETTIRVPRFDGLLYDSPLEGHQWMLFDQNHRRLRTDDLYPEGFTLDKGTYTIQVELRSADAEFLDKLRGTVLAVDRRLSSSLKVDTFPSAVAAATGRGTAPSVWLEPGEAAMLWLARPNEAKSPAGVQTGDVLLGEMTFVNSPDEEAGARSRPTPFPVTYVVPPTAPAAEPGPKVKEASPPLAEKLAEERLTLRIDQLSRLQWPADRELFEELQQGIVQDDPDAKRRILVAKLHLMDDDNRKDRLSEIVSVANEILETINGPELAARLALRADPHNQKVQQRVKEDEELKKTLIDALYRKGRALGYMELPEVLEAHPIEDQSAHDRAFEDNFQELAKWVDTTEADYVLLHIRRDRRQQRWGMGVQRLNTLIDETSPPKKMLFEKRQDLYEALGWNDWRDYEHRWILIRFPAEEALPF